AWINGPHLRFFQSAEKRSRVQKKGLSACPNTQRDPVQERQQENDVPTIRYELLDASAEKWYLQPKASYLSDIFAHNVLPLVTPTSSPPPQSPTRATEPPPPVSALPSSGPWRRRFWGKELLRAGYPLPRESSRCDRGRARSRRAGECRTLALPGRSRSASALPLRSCRGRERFCSVRPAGEYGSSPTPAPSHSAPHRRRARAPWRDRFPACPCLHRAAR